MGKNKRAEPIVGGIELIYEAAKEAGIYKTASHRWTRLREYISVWRSMNPYDIWSAREWSDERWRSFFEATTAISAQLGRLLPHLDAGSFMTLVSITAGVREGQAPPPRLVVSAAWSHAANLLEHLEQLALQKVREIDPEQAEWEERLEKWLLTQKPKLKDRVQEAVEVLLRADKPLTCEEIFGLDGVANSGYREALSAAHKAGIFMKRNGYYIPFRLKNRVS